MNQHKITLINPKKLISWIKHPYITWAAFKFSRIMHKMSTEEILHQFENVPGMVCTIDNSTGRRTITIKAHINNEIISTTSLTE